MSALPSRVRVAVLGAGSWGTALAALACTQADTLLWARKPELVRAISSEHVNAAYLPGIPLPAALQATDSLQQALERSEEHTSELQSLMRISYDVLCLKKKKQQRY